MLDLHAIKPQDVAALSADDLAALATRMLAHIGEQSRHIGEQDKRIDSQAQAIKWRDAKIESITFQLARLKAWKFGAKTEAMNAEQRDIFEETLAADQASLEAHLAPRGLARLTPQTLVHPTSSNAASPSASHCRRTCPAWTSASSPKTPIARRPNAASRWCAWARTSASGLTSCRRSSSCSGRSAASGPASAASCCCRSRPRRRSSTTRCQRQACRPTRWSAASSITFRITGRSRSTPARGCTRRARRWQPGAARPACS